MVTDRFGLEADRGKHTWRIEFLTRSWLAKYQMGCLFVIIVITSGVCGPITFFWAGPLTTRRIWNVRSEQGAATGNETGRQPSLLRRRRRLDDYAGKRDCLIEHWLGVLG